MVHIAEPSKKNYHSGYKIANGVTSLRKGSCISHFFLKVLIVRQVWIQYNYINRCYFE